MQCTSVFILSGLFVIHLATWFNFLMLFTKNESLKKIVFQKLKMAGLQMMTTYLKMIFMGLSDSNNLFSTLQFTTQAVFLYWRCSRLLLKMSQGSENWQGWMWMKTSSAHECFSTICSDTVTRHADERAEVQKGGGWTLRCEGGERCRKSKLA